MKKLISLLLAVALVFSLVACGTDAPVLGEEAPAPTGGTSIKDANEANKVTVTETTKTTGERLVKVGVTNDPVTFAPWEASTSGRNLMIHMLYQTLLSGVTDPNTGDYTIYWILASGYEHEAGSKEYLVHIRDGIYDSAGNKVNAHDVVFSIEMCMEMGNNSSIKGFTVEAVDDLSVKFVFEKLQDVGDFEAALENVYIVSKAAYEASPDGMATTPVGTTAYVLSDYQSGVGYTLSKSEKGYWNDAANESKSADDGYCNLYETDNVDTVEYDIITDTSTMAIALEKGEIDIASSIGGADVSLFRAGGSAEGVATVWYLPAATMTLAPNCSPSSPMSNINLRKALFYCFDTAAVMMAGYGENYWLCSSYDTNLRSNYDPSYEDKDYFGYNFETAEKYLDAYYKETGTSKNDLHITLICSNKDDAYKKGAQVIQSYFCNLVGSDSAMEVVCLEDATFSSTYKDETAFDVVMDYQGTEKLYSPSVWDRKIGSGKGTAKFFIEDEHLNELLKASMSEATHSAETCAAVNDYLIEMAYHLGLGYGTTYRAAASWIGEVARGPHNSVAVAGCKYDWATKHGQ